jgi:carboxylesterase type B
MNVWTPRMPADGSTPSWPVIFFIHGGNFHDGAAGGLEQDGPLLYDGREIANATGTVVVVIQYRLGALGFLYLGDARDGTTVSGNFGLQDQVLAMTFVKANIASFGGDASRITLMGQSAGAMSISAHMSRGATAGLYQGAIMMSNPHGEAYRDRDGALAIAGAFGNFSGCGQSLNLVINATEMEACLRTKDAATILAAQMQAEIYLLADLSAILQVVVAWSPTIGTAYLPLRPLEAFQSGTVPSGQSRAPTTTPRAGAANDTDAPRAHTSTGNVKSSVLPSSYFTRPEGGKITSVLRTTSMKTVRLLNLPVPLVSSKTTMLKCVCGVDRDSRAASLGHARFRLFALDCFRLFARFFYVFFSCIILMM